MADVFISYARSDRDRIALISEALQTSGVSCWWDGNLAGGMEYSREIEGRIEAAKAVVVVWSPASVESTWVADEAELGRDAGKLVPLVIDGAQPKIGFRQYQSIDFNHWSGDLQAPCFTALIQTLSRFLPPSATGEASQSRDTTPSRSTEATTSTSNGDQADAPIELDPAALQSARPALTPLVGREAERKTIEVCLERAIGGQGGMLFIGGEPGVGKTRIAEECLALAHEHGMLTLVGHAYEERGEPFIVAVEIIEALMRVLPGPALRQILGDSAAEVARLMPGLRDRFSDIPSPVELAPEQRQRYLYNAMLDFTRRLTQTVPCVILLDDLHWADESSMTLLEHIAPNISDLPLLYVVTYRDVASDMGPPFRRALSKLGRLQNTTSIALKQLTSDDIAALLARLGRPDPPASLVEIVYAESGGNALFAQSIYQSLAEEGRLYDTKGEWRTDISRADLVVPNDVRLIIEQRVGRLSPDTRQLLVMAAVLGLRFEPDVLEEALECDDDSVLDGIEEAEAANLIFPTTGQQETRYEFSHALVRQSLLDMTTPLRRERLHLRAASALGQVFGEDPTRAASLARHLLSAGRRAETSTLIRFLKLAGVHANEAFSFDEAVGHFDAALEKIPEGHHRERGEILEQRGNAHRALGNWPASERDWVGAIKLMADSIEPDRLSKMAWNTAYQFAWQNRLAEGSKLLEETLVRVGEEPSAARARLLALLGHFRTNSGMLEEGDALQRQAIEMARALNDLRVLSSEIMFSRLYFFQHTFNVRAYIAGIEEIIPLQQRWGSPSDLSMTKGCGVVALTCAGRFDEVRALHAELMPVAMAAGDTGTASQLELFDGHVDALTGDFENGRRRQAKVVEMFRAADMPWTSATMAVRAGATILTGKWETAEAEILDAIDIMVDCPSFYGLELAPLLYLYTLKGDPRARPLLEEYAEFLPTGKRLNTVGAYNLLMYWVECAVLMGEDERAAEYYEAVVGQIRCDAVTCYFPLLLERIAGIAAMAGGRFDQAEQHFQTALAQAEALNFVSELGDTRRWHAVMLLRRGKPGDENTARELLRESIAAYGANAMPKHEVIAQDLLKSLE